MILSICIPTHDGRAWTVRDAIKSVVDQITPDLIGKVEICVSDNGSQDETQEIVKAFADANPGLFVLHRFPENVGGRLNFLKVVSMAGGDWIWFLGSDDTFETNAIETGLKAIERHPDAGGLCVNRYRLDKTMTTVMADYPNHHPVEPDIEHVYTDVDDIICEIGIWQNYLSGCIFKKAEWDEIVRREGVEKITSYRHFTHSYVLACMTVDHPHWVWIPDKIVNYRSDNDAFYAVGYTLGRFVAEINDDIRRQFKDTLGTNSRGYRKVMKSMYELWYCPHQLRRWRLDPRNTYADDWYMRVSFTKAGFFVKHFWLNAFPRLIVPLPLLRLRYGFGPFLEKTMGPAHASVRTAARSMVNTARAVPKALAPRTRLRAALRQLNIENGWTQRYDAHVEHALELARRYETGLAHEMVFEPHYASGPESAQSIVARATSNGAGGPVIHFSSGEPDLLGAGDDNDRPETIKRVGNAD